MLGLSNLFDSGILERTQGFLVLLSSLDAETLSVAVQVLGLWFFSSLSHQGMPMSQGGSENKTQQKQQQK